MVVGPFARMLAQVVVPVIATVARALPSAYQQALANARKAGLDREAAAAAASATSRGVGGVLQRQRVDKNEALQILNLAEEEATVESIQRQFDKYMAANDISKGGGSFYLQSKVFRAKEMLDEYLEEKRDQDKQKKTTQ